MRFTTQCAAATGSALFVIWASFAGAGEVKPYTAKTVEPYTAKTVEPYTAKPVEQYTGRTVEQYTGKPVEQYTGRTVEQYGGQGDLRLPAGWSVSERSAKGVIYKRGECGLVFNEPKPMNGPYEAAAERYIDDSIRRLTEGGEEVVQMAAPTMLEDTGAVTRAFVTRSKGAPHWNVRVVAQQNGQLRPFNFRCSDHDHFKAYWMEAGQAIVGYLHGAPGGARQGQGQGIHLLTQEERQAMMRNDTAAGRTHDSMQSGRDGGGNASGAGASGGGARLYLGTWYGANVMGQIDIHPDGTYSSPNGARGQWQATGDRSLVFTSGPLTAWNGGRASISDKNALEFKWTTPQGQKQYFVYIRR